MPQPLFIVTSQYTVNRVRKIPFSLPYILILHSSFLILCYKNPLTSQKEKNKRVLIYKKKTLLLSNIKSFNEQNPNQKKEE